jgi:hypothetical protein
MKEEDNTRYGRGVQQQYVNSQKNESNRNPGSKNSLKSNKKYGFKPL